MIAQNTKRCSQCGAVKPLSEFYTSPCAADPSRRRSECKACSRASSRAASAREIDRNGDPQMNEHRETRLRARAAEIAAIEARLRDAGMNPSRVSAAAVDAMAGRETK